MINNIPLKKSGDPQQIGHCVRFLAENEYVTGAIINVDGGESLIGPMNHWWYMDKILIKDLLTRGIVGINDWEREKLQDILVNLEIDYDLNQAGLTDDIKDTLNYKALTKSIIKHIENNKPYLVEKLATDIANIAIKQGALKVKVRVEKPMALRFADSVGVEIVRERK